MDDSPSKRRRKATFRDVGPSLSKEELIRRLKVSLHSIIYKSIFHGLNFVFRLIMRHVVIVWRWVRNLAKQHLYNKKMFQASYGTVIMLFAAINSTTELLAHGG